MRRILIISLLATCSLCMQAETVLVETFRSTGLKHMIVCPTSNPNTPQTFLGDNGLSWEYWLGGGNHAVFGASDSCMYIRARKSSETCAEGYLRTVNPIAGGLKSLSLEWKQGGAEGGINYDIAIYVNDSVVGRIQQAGEDSYDATTATAKTYTLNNINVTGNFTLRIENQTAYSGTSNKGRFVFNNLTLTLMDEMPDVPTVHGYVRDQNGQPIADAVVSDGFDVVKTDANGYYSFAMDEHTEFVFVSVPTGFDIPMDEDGAPHMYERVTPQGYPQCDFTLNRQADGGRADSTHVMLAISDPQVLNEYDLWRYETETLEDIKALVASYPKGTKFYASIVGDIVWDYYTAMDKQKANMASLGFPCFMTIGNHDHNCKHACVSDDQDRVADDLYTAVFGPTCYSYNIGGIHYVSVDNVLYTGCGGNKSYLNQMRQEHIDWLLKDLAMLADNTPIVLFCHVPMYNEASTMAEIQDALKKGSTVQYIISGHTHRPRLTKHSDTLWEHTLGAAEGAFWSSNWCDDGAPNGYEVLQAGQGGYTDFYYKGTGFDRDYQLRAYAPGSINSKDGYTNYLRANVWFWDEQWQVYVYEDGVRHAMTRYTGTDPLAYDVMIDDGDTRPNYPGSDGGTIASKNPGSNTSQQMFRYKPTDPNADFVVEAVDRFGNTYNAPVLRNMMVATFAEKEGVWSYQQDFNSLFAYPNQHSASLAKGTFVQGHYPTGWYATTSGTSGSSYNTFNYYRIGNGSHIDGGLYNYGAGDPSVATANSTERSLGLLPSASHKSVAVGVLFENNTKEDITELDITYTGKVWRMCSVSGQHTLHFSYMVNPDAKALRERTQWIGELQTTTESALDFSTPSTLSAMGTKVAVDGDNANNQSVINGKLPVLIHPGETILLRWESAYNQGQEQGMAIDDVVVTAKTQPTGTNDLSATVCEAKKILRDGQILIRRGNKTYTPLGQLINE